MKKLLVLMCGLFTLTALQAAPIVSNSATTTSEEVGDSYIDIALKDTNGDVVKVSELLAEGKWVLIDFWATWCGPCRAEISHLVKAYGKFAPKGLEIYGVSLDRPGTEAAWKEFVKKNGMSWVNVWGYEGRNCKAAEEYDVEFIPTNFLVSPSGEIVAMNLRGEEIEKILAEHIR